MFIMTSSYDERKVTIDEGHRTLTAKEAEVIRAIDLMD